jgi:hypothetical protein
MEQLTLAGVIGQTGCALCEVAGDDLLPDPREAHVAAPRTALTARQTLARMASARSAGRLTEYDNLRTSSRLQGTPSILLQLYERGLSATLAASNNSLAAMVPASVMPFDTLHVFDEGWTKRILNAFAAHLDRLYGKATGRWLTDTLASRFQTILEMTFIENTRWPNPHRVFRSGSKKEKEGCGGLQACEMRAVCQLMPVLLHGIWVRSSLTAAGPRAVSKTTT